MLVLIEISATLLSLAMQKKEEVATFVYAERRLHVNVPIYSLDRKCPYHTSYNDREAFLCLMIISRCTRMQDLVILSADTGSYYIIEQAWTQLSPLYYILHSLALGVPDNS